MSFFLNGVHVPHRKRTAGQSAVYMPAPKSVTIPMLMHIGAPARPTVKVGDRVYVGTLVAEAVGPVSSPVYASVSGKVTKISDFLLASGNSTSAVIIESDGEMQSDPMICAPAVTSREELIEAIRASGPVGLGGAGFPTHGKDGLASGCTIFCSFTFAVFTYLMGHKIFAGYLDLPFISGIEEAVVFAFAVCGCCIGFLWHNCHPASMFMGDTGSLALGGAISLLAVLVRQEILMFVVGGVFSMEFASVVLQRYYYKMTKKRIFLCSPIHHHFEKLGWTETQIVVRFWILSGLFAMIALGTLKLR